jgi:hypothetical protein
MTSPAATPVRRSQARFQIMTRQLVSSTNTGIASISMSWCAKARSLFALEESMSRCIVVPVMCRPLICPLGNQLIADKNRLCGTAHRALLI